MMPDIYDSTREPLLVGSSSGRPSYGIDGDIPTTHNSSAGGHGDAAKIVHFSAGDPEDPRNWPTWKKWLMIGPILLIDLSVSWGASGFSPASKKFADDFNLPASLGTLGLSSYVLGLAFGPMTLAPLSEVRRNTRTACLGTKNLMIEADITAVLRKTPDLHLFLLRLPMPSRCVGCVP